MERYKMEQYKPIVKGVEDEPAVNNIAGLILKKDFDVTMYPNFNCWIPKESDELLFLDFMNSGKLPTAKHFIDKYCIDPNRIVGTSGYTGSNHPFKEYEKRGLIFVPKPYKREDVIGALKEQHSKR